MGLLVRLASPSLQGFPASSHFSSGDGHWRGSGLFAFITQITFTFSQ